MGRRGLPFVVAAPSGAGKTTVCRAVVERDPDIVFSVSHTTRIRRPGEREGVDYHFVDREAFLRLAEQQAFLEYAEYSGNLYGTSWAAIREPLARGLDVLLEIEIEGAKQVRDRLPEARLVFLLPPSLAELERRLRARGTDSASEIARRLRIARREISQVALFDYAIVNVELEHAIAALRQVLAAERRGASGDARARYAPSAMPAALRAALGL